MLSSTTARPPIPSPNATIVALDTLTSCLPEALGFLYVLYRSYVTSEDTAINSADPAEVTAMNNIVNTIIAPISPISAVAAAGTTKPI